MFYNMSWATFLWILIVFLLVDAIKTYMEIWRRPKVRDFDTDLSRVTALIPTYNGGKVIGQTLEDLLKMGLSQEQIVVVDDGSTDDTAQIVKSFGVRYSWIPNMGKVHAIHFGIFRVKTDYVLLLDDDTRVADMKLPTSLMDSYSAVAFKVLPDRRNRYGPKGQSFTSCIQRYEYAKSMEIGRRFLDGTASISCISGAVGLFHTKRLIDLHHHHSGAFEGEDFQRTILEHLYGGNVAFVEQTAWTAAPDNFRGLFRQRLWYWYPAHYHMFLNYLKLMIKPRTPGRLRAEMAYNMVVVLGEPLRFWSLVMLAYHQVWEAFALIYGLYFALEIYPFVTIQRQMDTGKRLAVLFVYPVYNMCVLVLRVLAVFVWLWKRFVSKEMKPKTAKDRKWWVPADADFQPAMEESEEEEESYANITS